MKRTVAAESCHIFASQDMNQSAQYINASKYYHGNGSVPSQIDQFMTGTGRYGNVEVKDMIPSPPSTTKSIICSALHASMIRQHGAATHKVSILIA